MTRSSNFFTVNHFLLTILILLTAKSFAEIEPYYSEVQKKSISREDAEFTYEKLASLIKEKKLNSVEKTLAHLPASMRKNFLLIRESLSLQKSNDLYPRAILFKDDATLSCSFGGHKSLIGFDSLECYQFLKDSDRFEFREIVFPSPENQLNEVQFSLPNRQAVGPVSCTSCHSQDPHPIWEPYSTWKGAYGSFDDSFYLKNESVYSDASTQENNEKIVKERSAFETFKSEYKNSPRYSQLLFGKEKLSPFSNKNKDENFATRPNLRFTNSIGDLMVKRNIRKMKQLDVVAQADFMKASLFCKSPHLSSQEMQPEYEQTGLEKFFSLRDWLPAFRSPETNCTVCNYTAQSETLVSRYIFMTGTVDINTFIAANLIKEYVENGKLPQDYLKIVIVQNGLQQLIKEWPGLRTSPYANFEDFFKNDDLLRLKLCDDLSNWK